MAHRFWPGLLVMGALGVSCSWAPAAQAADVEIAVTIEHNRFTPNELKVKAGVPFVLVVTNKDGAVEEFESKDLHIEKLVPAGKTVRIRIPALKSGTYPFVGEYHAQTARGRILVE